MDHSAHGHMDHSAHGHMDHSAHGHMNHTVQEHVHVVNQNHVDHQGDVPTYLVPTDQPQDHHGDHSSHGHQTFFNTGMNATVLFENWILDTNGSIFLACLCTFILAMGYQGTKWFRQYLHVHFKYHGKIHSIKSKEHMIQTVLYVTEFLVSYFLMLIVMTYNVWVFVVTILGIALGYFLLAWHKEFKPTCAMSYPTPIEEVNLTYDRNASSQELVPLGGSKGACKDCDSIDEIEEDK